MSLPNCSCGNVARTSFGMMPDTAVALGFERPEKPIEIPVCHGCYLFAMSWILQRFGLPRASAPATNAAPSTPTAAAVPEGKPL